MAAHADGWPVVEGGSARIAEAAGRARVAGRRDQDRPWVSSIDELPPARAVLMDITPRQLPRWPATAAGPHRPPERFRYGPGVCKVDWALSGPVPWQAPACREAGTVHLGGTLAEIARAKPT